MKKYLVTGLAAVAISGMFTSCTHDTDGGNGNTNLGVVETYEQAFISRFGTPSPEADWGFGNGATKAGTRASELLKEKFTLPSFRGKKDITEPTWPGLPTTLDGKSFYTTWEQVQDAKIPCADEVTSNNNEWTNVYTAYIDADHTNIRSDRSAGRTYYVNGDVKYWNGVSADGATFIVLEGSTLHLGSINHNIKIYLCRNATVDFTKTWEVKTDVISWWPYEATTTITEKDVEVVTLEKSNAAIYMNEGSNVKAKTLEVFDGANIYNDGGTIEASYLYIHKNSNLYNNGGEVKVNNGKIYAFDGCKVLVGNGCEVTADQMDIDKNTTLWNNGSIKVTRDIQGNNDYALIYNAPGKTIEAASINLKNNYNLLVNYGTVKVDNEITLQNTNAEIVNNADMECGSFSQAAGAKMYNVGNMTVDGLTHLDNSNSGWQNEGQWTCGSFEALGNDKGAGNNFNNCRLTVEGEFYLNREAFILDSDAGVECGSFKIDDTSGFYLGNNSVLKIDGTLTTEIINPEYGFFAYGSEYAAVQANSIVSTTHDPQSINYYGNLLVAINPHLPESEYTAESTVKFTKDNQNIATIPETPCNPGYEGEEPGGGDETGGDDDDDNPSIRVIAEDMGDQSLNENSDFDFNDVVFDVTWVSESEVDVEILAASGTLPLTIGWNGNETNESGYIDYEVHNLLGYSETMIINTHSSVGNHIDGVPSKHLTLNGTFRKDHFAEDVRDNIPVKVRKNNRWYEIKADQGKVAGKLAVDKEYEPWCNERKDIDDWWINADKQGLFLKYTQDPTTLTKYWYKQAKFRQLKPGEYTELK